jgi:hypothetical protein
MRRVRFTLYDRLVLIPVELVHVLWPLLIATVAVYFVSGLWAAVAVAAAILAGVVLFPILLPWIPTRDFSSKGFILGGLVVLPFALRTFLRNPDAAWWLRLGTALTFLLSLPPVTAFITLNFTGSTTFTSRTGVRREMFRYIPVMAWMFGTGVVLTLVLLVVQWLGGTG